LRIIPQDRKLAEIKENAESNEKFGQDEFGCWVEAQTNLDNAKINPILQLTTQEARDISKKNNKLPNLAPHLHVDTCRPSPLGLKS
jgi:hypothetical protein